jgi:4'-phosphopantetheinyl transferase
MSGEVTVWWADLDARDAESFEPLLSADELGRAAGLRFARDRSRFIAARGMLRALLGDRLGTDPARIEFAYGEHGKPRLADETGLRFNLSHSGPLLALVICGGREVGIDVEAISERVAAKGIARRYLPAEMAAEIGRRSGRQRTEEFFRAWVRQEAYAKGCGGGLELIGRAPGPSWTLVDLELAPGYAAALALRDDALLDGGEQLVADLPRVRHPAIELRQAGDVLRAGAAEPAG